MKDDILASIEPIVLIEDDEITGRTRAPLDSETVAESSPCEYFKHIERLEVRFVIENVNKPFMPIDLRERITTDGLREKHEGEYVRSGDVKTTIAFENGTAPTDGSTEELTDIFIDHMWNFVRELKKYR